MDASLPPPSCLGLSVGETRVRAVCQLVGWAKPSQAPGSAVRKRSGQRLIALPCILYAYARTRRGDYIHESG